MPRFQVDINVNFADAARSAAAYKAQLLAQLQAFQAQVASTPGITRTQVTAGLGQVQAAGELGARQSFAQGQITSTQLAARLEYLQTQINATAQTMRANVPALQTVQRRVNTAMERWARGLDVAAQEANRLARGEAATRARAQALTTPATTRPERLLPQGLRGLHPSEREVANLEKYVNLLRQEEGLLNRYARRQELGRRIGLEAGKAETEQALRGPDAEENLGLRAGLNELRREQEVVERQATEQLRLANRDLIEQTARLAATLRQRQIVEEQAALVSRAGLTGDEAAVRIARERARAAIAVAQRAQQTPGDTEAVAAGAAAERARAAEVRAATARRAAADRSVVGALAAQRQAEQALTAEVNRARRELAAQTRREQASAFQRLQAYIHQRQTGAPADPSQFLGLGQFATSRLLTTAGFAASGALLYGGIQSIRTILQEAGDLDRILNQIERQFVEVDDAAQFPRAREAILEIARRTGEAADSVATVFFQFRGAFEETERAIVETNAAITLTRITGLSLQEVVDSLTASAISFGVGIEDIGDNAIGLQERFGVLANQTITFVADLAAVAEQIGFTGDEGLRKIAALGAVAQQVSGRSGAALAEGFNRILPAIGQARTAILDLYTIDPGLAVNRQEVLEALGAGQTGVVFERLIRDYNSMTQSQKNYVIELLGGRREAQALIPVLENSAKLVQEWDRSTDDAGKTASYFSDLQDTLQQRMSRLREVFTQLGEELFRGGLGDALKDITSTLAVLVNFLRLGLGVFSALNEATDGWAGRLVFAALMAKGLTVAITALIAVQQARAAASAAESVASATAARFDTAQAAASANVTAAKVAEAAAVTNAARADTAEAITSERNAVANRGQAAAGVAGNVPGAGVPPAAAARGLGAVARSPGGILVGLIGAQLVLSAFQSNKADVQAAEQALRDKVSAANKEDLERLAQDRNSFWDRVSSTIFSTDLPSEIAGTELVRRDAQQDIDRVRTALEQNLVNLGERNAAAIANAVAAAFDIDITGSFDQVLALLNAGGASIEDGRITDLSGFGRDDVEKIVKQAEGGNETAARVLSVIRTVLEMDSAVNVALNEIFRQADEAEALADTRATGTQDVIQRFEEVQQAYQAGIASSAQFLAALNREISNLQELQAAGAADKDTARALATYLADRQKFFDEQAQSAADLRLRILNASGAGGADATIATLQTQLADPTISPRAQYDVGLSLLEALQARFQQAIQDAATPAERLALLRQGFEIPEGLRALIVGAQLNLSEPVQRFVEQAARILHVSVDSITNQLIQAILTGRAALIDVQRQILQAQIDKLRANLLGGGVIGIRQAENVGLQIAELEGQINDLLSGIGVGQEVFDPGPIGNINDAAQQIASNVAAAAADARAEALARARAGIAVRRAMAANNAALQAQLDVEEALLEASFATNTTEALEARARLIEAQARVAQAAADTFAAQHELLAAIAEARGDIVEVALQQLIIAQDALARLQSSGGGAAELARAQADIVAAEARLRDAQLATQQRDIDFALQMEQITIGQAIAQLEALLQIPNLTIEQTQALLLKIKQLRDELGRDAAFNLGPIDIGGLFYQARRIEATSNAGMGYQDNRSTYYDNRSISFAPTISSQALLDEFMAEVDTILSEPPRVGPRARAY